MNGLLAFTKKELLEQLRSFKALILLAVLFLFGMSSPLLAKMMPAIFAQIATPGLSITIPDPTISDAWDQFFKNVGQMGLIVLLLVFSGTLSQELSRGTLVLPLSKGLSRSAVILSKYFAALASWTVCYALAAAVACGYTQYLFQQFTMPHLFLLLLSLWLFGAFLLALILLCSTIASGNYGGLLLTVAIMAVLLIANAFPAVHKWNPATLASVNAAMLAGAGGVTDLLTTIWITVGLTLTTLLATLALFWKKRI